jgi:hypothetical protein
VLAPAAERGRLPHKSKEPAVAADQRWLVCLRLLTVVLALVSAPLVARAQPAAGKVPRIGLLGVTSASGYARQLEAMRQEFRDLGYVEDQNIVIEYRWANAQYDQLPALAAELFRLQPDAIITSGPGIRILRRMSTEA